MLTSCLIGITICRSSDHPTPGALRVPYEYMVIARDANGAGVKVRQNLHDDDTSRAVFAEVVAEAAGDPRVATVERVRSARHETIERWTAPTRDERRR